MDPHQFGKTKIGIGIMQIILAVGLWDRIVNKGCSLTLRDMPSRLEETVN